MRFANDDKKTEIQLNKSRMTLSFFDILKTFILFFTVICIIFTFFVREVNIDGESMKDTLFNGDKVMLSNLFYTPKVGDIVAIDADQQIGKIIIKRVIAVGGQTVKIDYDNNKVIVDGVVLDEDYVASPTNRPTISWDIPQVIPEGYIFVMGDNRSVSLDSRSGSVQLIPEEMVIGKAQLVIYPFDHVKYLY